MYVYLEPLGGLNDILYGIIEAHNYCETYNRTLLVNGMKSVYKINFVNYFSLPLPKYSRIIFDTEQIKKICCNKEYKIYPNELQDKMVDILEGKCDFSYEYEGIFYYNPYSLEHGLPKYTITENIIIYCREGGGNTYKLFKELIFKPSVIDVCKARYNKLNKPYLCIHVRNTDYKCDYITHFKQNEKLIRSFKEIYIATDSVEVINFYRKLGLSVKNYTTFPENYYTNLHSSNVDSHIKFIDMLCDIYIIGAAYKLISNSSGSFIKLVTYINKTKLKVMSTDE
jgi:hypothetical protein